MTRCKKILREIGITTALAVVAFTVIIGVLAYKDWRGCVCSVLTDTEQTLPMDERFYRVCEKDTLRSGTFSMIRTKCEHGKQLVLTVHPDIDMYSGYVVSEN